MDDQYPCNPPRNAEIGDVWYCPGCARKFQYILMTYEDEEAMNVWFTDEKDFM